MLALATEAQESVSTVRRALLGEGVTARPRGRSRKAASIDQGRLRELADGTRTTAEIGALMGYSAETIRRQMIVAGIPRLPGKARPEKNYFWRGGRTIDKHGYVLVKVPKDHPMATKIGYVREHRLVMAEVLGRPLTRREVVHHRNGDRADNRPENLELFASNADHLRHELTGKCPQWTEDGKRRIREGIRREHQRRRATSRQQTETDGGP